MGKPAIWDFFVEVEFDASMISSTIELTRVQVLDRSCYACVWHFCILRVTRKSIKWTWVELFEMNVKIEQELNFVVDDSQLFLDAQEAIKVSECRVV